MALLESGAQVILTDLADESEDTETRLDVLYRFCWEQAPSKNRPVYHKMDVTDEEQIKAVATKYSPQILVNNAALDPKVSPTAGLSNSSRFEQLSLDFWHQGLAVTLDGTFLCCRIFGNQMIAAGKGGVIINIASELASLAPDQRLYERPDVPLDQQSVKPVTYMVAKAGVVALTKYLATYPSFLKAGIRINALSPSGVFNNHPAEFVNKLSSRIPMGRMANRDEYRGALQFLASDASAYMNGQNLIMDGGKSVW